MPPPGAACICVMAILDIIKSPDPILKQECAPVGRVDDEIRTLMDDMLETMYKAPGIGLAAVQIGVTRRVIVMDISTADDDPGPLHLVNPEILWASGETAHYEEGCLSLPDHFAKVERPAAIRIKFLDYSGAERELEAKDTLATCIQHEMDHLEGILFVDRISLIKRSMILRKLAKARKLLAAE